MQNEKTGTKHLFQAVFLFSGYVSRQYKLYLRAFAVSRKTSHKFSDASHFEQKKIGLGFTIMKVSNSKKSRNKGVPKFREWSRDLSHQNTCTLCWITSKLSNVCLLV